MIPMPTGCQYEAHCTFPACDCPGNKPAPAQTLAKQIANDLDATAWRYEYPTVDVVTFILARHTARAALSPDIKAALGDAGLVETIWRETCVGHGALRFVADILNSPHLHAAVQQLIDAETERCAAHLRALGMVVAAERLLTHAVIHKERT